MCRLLSTRSSRKMTFTGNITLLHVRGVHTHLTLRHHACLRRWTLVTCHWAQKITSNDPQLLGLVQYLVPLLYTAIWMWLYDALLFTISSCMIWINWEFETYAQLWPEHVWGSQGNYHLFFGKWQWNIRSMSCYYNRYQTITYDLSLNDNPIQWHLSVEKFMYLPPLYLSRQRVEYFYMS